MSFFKPISLPALILALCAIPLAYEGFLLLREARVEAKQSYEKFNKFVDGLDLPIQKALAQIAAVGKVTAQIEAKERNHEDEQQAYYAQIGTDSHDAFGRVDDLLTSADKTIKDIGSSVVANSGDIHSGMQHLGYLSDDTRGFVQAATEDAKQIGPVIENANQSTANLAVMTKEGAATFTDARKAADYELGELMKPVKKIKVAADLLVHFAGKFWGY